MGRKILLFMRTWMLAVSIVCGILLYLPFIFLASTAEYEEGVFKVIKMVQPVLIFTMLFITFCKTSIRRLHVQKWHVLLLAIQVGLFASIAMLILLLNPHSHWVPVIHAAMLCLICPTGTAAAVVTGKLGGDVEGLTTYTILINAACAIIIPIFVPLLSPHATLGFWASLSLISAKVFPLLVCPLLGAVLMVRCFPRTIHRIVSIKDLALKIWAVSLALAIMVSTQSICHSPAPLWVMASVLLVSLLSCVFQFWAGRRIGRAYHAPISSAQSLGQKNTVFLIWCGYTFFDPLSSIAGGFYSIWHNLWNSYQLRKVQKAGA